MRSQTGVRFVRVGLMAVHRVLSLLVSVSLSVIPAPAQEPLPPSTQARLATHARLERMTLSDFTNLISQAQSGEPKAQYLVAVAYRQGRLVAKDVAVAERWMRKSAERDYVPAQAGMAALYLNGVDYYGPIPYRDEAERWLRLAAQQGDADAQFWLGTAYQRGWLGALDDRRALYWIKKAASQGLPLAQFRLGQMYEDGEGIPQKSTLAANWYRKAADHSPSWIGGVFEAEVQLADMYRNGRLAKDDVQAYMWFAIVGSAQESQDDSDIKRIARHMSKVQIVQAQRMAEDWIKRHRRPAH